MAIEFVLLRRRNTWLRPDTLPFIIAYILLLLWQLQIEDELTSVYARLSLIGIVFANSLVFLSSYWSSHMRARVQFSSFAQRSITIDLLHKHSTQKRGDPIVTSFQSQQSTTKYNNKQKDDDMYFIRFMESKYILDENKKQFVQLKPNVKFDLQNVHAQQPQRYNNFDKNSLLIPMKKFNDILREQLMEPFSFFQMFDMILLILFFSFSISLWLLDENALYALFTLALLFMTGLTVAIQRMRTMLTLRQMKLNHQYVTVHRNKSWVKISSEDLIPGDICILQTADQAKPVVVVNKEVQQMKQVNPMLPPVVLNEDEQFMKDQVPFNKYMPSRLFKTESMNVDSFKSLPCDILLLCGTAVVNEAMLTGESVPQVKDAVEHIHHSEHLDVKGKHKQNVLFCGTEIIQVQGTLSFPQSVTPPKQAQCLGLVLRTGFDTAKGKLIKTVFYNNENSQVQQLDGLVIVLVLLIFALISSANVLYHGLGDSSRDKNKLFLRCILIVTTVVPPELPMILSIAVNQSLLFLQMRKIFCTEPYRIPLAGKVSILAFDKTGTLTNDQLRFVGITDDCSLNLKQRSQVSIETQTVLAACQGLVFAEDKLQGDPIELLFFEQNNQWSYSAQMKTAVSSLFKREVMIRSVMQFKSDLKRMSTLVIQEDNQKKRIKVLTKGAPETIQHLLTSVPEGFTECYEHFTNLGYRVLCLADRVIEDSEFGLDPSLFPMQKASQLAELDRTELECNLTYRGLLICESPLKNDTVSWIEKFRKSYFMTLIITGDNMLTAIAVAKQVGLHFDKQNKDRKPIILEAITSTELYWVSGASRELIVNKKDIVGEFREKAKTNMLCIPSQTLSALTDHPQLHLVLSLFTVFARMSPKQKEQIILGLKKAGNGVLMCGDGTNDVGGLKKADVGIALVTKHTVGDEAPEKDEDDEEDAPQLSFTQQMKKVKEQQDEMRRKMQQGANRQQMAQQQMQDVTKDLFSMGTTYKFGDACIAAPFTSKMSTSIKCVHTILKQGVCTLVTTIQTYKIMALLSLINAYSLSSLHMQSLKLSSNQMTIMGIFGTAYYFCYSSARPQRYLSSVKPSSTIFEFSFLVSLTLQITLHIATMDYALHQIGIHYSSAMELNVDNDLEFTPTFLNTVVFLIQMLQQSCIFLFNHPGEPHMTRLDIKSKFFKSLAIPLVICIVGALNISDDINYFFELKFPDRGADDAAYQLGALCIFITVTNYLIERVMKYCKYGKFYGYI